MTKLMLALSVLAVLVASCAKPPDDPESRARRVGSQLRCPICRGVSIADSPSELAQQMMGVVRQQIAQGKGDDDILQYFEERYGQWILLKPKAQGINLVVWLLPPLVILGGGAVILVEAKKMKSRKEVL
jgi:cytochrome c-type biogenesis protein CcmH